MQFDCGRGLTAHHAICTTCSDLYSCFTLVIGSNLVYGVERWFRDSKRRTGPAVLLAILLTGCTPDHKEVVSAAQPIRTDKRVALLPHERPGIPMVERLRLINESFDPLGGLGDNERKAKALRSQADAETEPAIRDSLLLSYAEELLKAGRTGAAIDVYESVLKRLPPNPLDAGVDLSAINLQLAVAYMRQGEQDNCLAGHTAESCLLPIHGSGVHKLQRGSRAAIRVLTYLLKHDPDELSARWLLNVAYMTVGEYPARVPTRWLIPPDRFRSDCAFPKFQEIAGSVGLDLQQLSGGVIAEDFDNDGFLDIVISCVGMHEQIHYFHNDGNGKFTDRAEAAGLRGQTGGLNIVQTDYDNDGWMDILVLRGGWYGRAGHWPLSLLHNNGNGTFTDVTEKAGLLRFKPTQTAAWFDFDGDGFLDLFVGNETANGDVNPCELFHNNRNGTFTECAAASGLDLSDYVKGCATADYDNDGRPDLFVSVVLGSNRLFHNDGPSTGSASGRFAWKFTDVTARAGVAEPMMSFPCFFFDYDNDGWADLYVAGYNLGNMRVGQVAADYLGKPVKNGYGKLYHNNRDGTFADVTEKAHLRKLAVGMGINYGDLDNDGWLDFYIGTGNPILEFLTPNRMFRNMGGHDFADVTTAGGFGHLQKGHGIAFADLNNDGTQDIYESMGGIYDGDVAFAALYNNPGFGNHWITVKAIGVQSNRAALGARLKITIAEAAGQRDIYKTVSTGGSFGANPFRQEIGLGKASHIVRAEIFWPKTGKTQVVDGLSPDGSFEVTEGDRMARRLPLKSFAYSTQSNGGHRHRHQTGTGPGSVTP